MTPEEFHAARRAMQRKGFERFLMKRLGCSIRPLSETPDEHDDRVAEDRLARWYARMDTDDETPHHVNP